MNLPAPLVDVEVDLRDFEFMPLDVARLRNSVLASEESPEACWAAVLLWCASWHEVPAASLPDNDKHLAQVTGYGRVVTEWLRVREGALRGWIKCADGRLYHPVVAEKAIEAWLSKLRRIFNTECETLKKRAQRRGDQFDRPEFEDWLLERKALMSQGLNEDVPGTVNTCPQDLTRGRDKGQGQGQGQGQGKEEGSGEPSLFGSGELEQSGKASFPDEQLAFEAFNEAARRAGLPLAAKLTTTRRAGLAKRLAECGGLDGWRAALTKLEASSFCCGNNSRGWRADLDFLLQPKSFTRLVEGGYDDRPDRGRSGGTNASGTFRSGGQRSFADEVRAIDEAVSSSRPVRVDTSGLASGKCDGPIIDGEFEPL